MPEYRIYQLNKDRGVMAPPKVHRCSKDATALAIARDLVDEYEMEVWEGGRRVGSVLPGPSRRG